MIGREGEGGGLLLLTGSLLNRELSSSSRRRFGLVEGTNHFIRIRETC